MKMNKCICHTAPMGQDSLEGFILDMIYFYDIYRNEKGRKEYTVFLTKDGYKYEVKKQIFKRYFKVL